MSNDETKHTHFIGSTPVFDPTCDCDKCGQTRKELWEKHHGPMPTPSPLPPDTGSEGTPLTQPTYTPTEADNDVAFLISGEGTQKERQNAMAACMARDRAARRYWIDKCNAANADLTSTRHQLEQARRERDEAQATIARYQAVATNTIPGPHGEGVEVGASPEYLKASITALQWEWDMAEKRIAEMSAQLTASQSQVTRMCARVERGEFSEDCPFCLAKKQAPGVPNPMCHLCDLESDRDSLRSQISQLQKEVGEHGSRTDEPSPSGSTYARLGWWKRIADENGEEIEALRTTLTTTQAELATAKATIEGLEKDKIRVQDVLQKILRVPVGGIAWLEMRELARSGLFDAASQGTKRGEA